MAGFSRSCSSPDGILFKRETALCVKDHLDFVCFQLGGMRVEKLLFLVSLPLKLFNFLYMDSGFSFLTADKAKDSVCWSDSWSMLDQPNFFIIAGMDIQ